MPSASETTLAIPRARWQVLWTRDGRVIRRDKGPDLPGAIDLTLRAIAAGKRNVTLRSANVGFAPPAEKYADREKVALGRSKRTGKIVYEARVTDPPRYLTRMKTYNRRGWWWCPFCMKMRRFVKRKGFFLHGTRTWVDEPGYHCPMCDISHRDGNVRKYNPVALQLSMGKRRRGRRRSRRS